MRKVLVKMHNQSAGIFMQNEDNSYAFEYLPSYLGPAISLTLPQSQSSYHFTSFPPFFDGLLPEGVQLEGLLKIGKIDKKDFLSQLLATGEDLVGAVTIHPIANDE